MIRRTNFRSPLLRAGIRSKLAGHPAARAGFSKLRPEMHYIRYTGASKRPGLRTLAVDLHEFIGT